MKILILTKNWGRSFTGATLATQYLVDRWVKNGIDIDVYALNVRDCVNSSQIKVYKSNSISELKKLINKKQKSFESSVVGYSDDHFGYVLKELSIPYVHTYHGNWPDAKNVNFELWLKSHYFMPLYKKTIKFADIVINVSKYMETFTIKHNKKSHLIRNGIEVKHTETQLNIPYKYLMVGNVDKRKYDLLLEVADSLKSINACITIDVYGRIIDTGLERRLRAYKNIVLLGEKKEIPYRSYLGLVNTSKIENLSISVCEAIKNQVPVFCFNVGGLSEVVEDKKTGYMFDCFDTTGMALDLSKYCSNRKLSIPLDALCDFDWDIAGKKYLDLMMGICKK